VAWGFVLTAGLGLIEAAGFVLRHGTPQPAPPGGAFAAVLVAASCAGWFGALVALPAWWVLTFFTRGRPDAVALASAGAIALPAGLFLAITAGHLSHDAAISLWWRSQVGTLWLPRLGLALLLSAGLTVALRRPVRALLAGNSLRLFGPLVLLAAGVVLWPDGRQMARERHLAGLERRTAPAGAQNLVVVSIDALRADKVRCLSADAPPTPSIDDLAASGHRYANAWALSPWTLPSMAAALTGQPPRSLGVDRQTGLPGGATTLAEAAWRAGWDTAAIVANPYLTEAYGFPRGFGHWDHAASLETLHAAAASVLVREATRYHGGLATPSDGLRLASRARRWLQTREDDRPFFLWIHLMDVHLPYRQHPGGPAVPEHPWFEGGEFRALHELREALPDVSPAIRQAVEDLYDGEVVRADVCVGEVVGELRASGDLARTWFVVTSDHGEEFFEHGGFEHGHSLYPEVTAVPLIIRPPGGLKQPRRDDRPVTLLDLAPSLAAALGWSLPAETVGRPSLLPRSPDLALPEPTAPVVLENLLYGPPRQAWLRWPDLRITTADSARTLWFDLAQDPLARRPVGAARDAPELRETVGALLADWDSRARRLDAGDRDPVRLDEAARRRLRSLGY
jgi:arylsulfatase